MVVTSEELILCAPLKQQRVKTPFTVFSYQDIGTQKLLLKYDYDNPSEPD